MFISSQTFTTKFIHGPLSFLMKLKEYYKLKKISYLVYRILLIEILIHFLGHKNLKAISILIIL